ncbi:MAG: F0F1 ATP synthase subunit A [Prevotellaceae bacterium]|jgi:F-type H+-transporting ATPase subunit a|nr:F0F1 ATP synthase subunit A [Prevotellaceae bacterium]
MKYFKHIILIFFVLFSATVFAENDTVQTAENQEFNIKEMIFEHIGDAYEWHLLGHTAIPLPIIVRSSNTGWHVFSAARLEHGETYNGFVFSVSENHKGKVVEINAQGEEIRPLDLSLTKNVISIFMTCAILLTIFLTMAYKYKKEPIRSRRGFLGTIEMLTMSIYEDVIKPCVGHDYKRFAPYLLTVFFFIFTSNLMGLIPFFPFGANVTGNIAVTFVLAMFTFVITNVFGNKHYWKEVFNPDVPIFLKAIPIMPLVEFLGLFTKPLALMIRLFANMMSGHMVVLVFVGLIFIFNIMMGAVTASLVSVVSVAFSIFMIALDVLISFIQAYVFTILSSIFIGMARAEHH